MYGTALQQQLFSFRHFVICCHILGCYGRSGCVMYTRWMWRMPLTLFSLYTSQFVWQRWCVRTHECRQWYKVRSEAAEEWEETLVRDRVASNVEKISRRTLNFFWLIIFLNIFSIYRPFINCKIDWWHCIICWSHSYIRLINNRKGEKKR